MKRNINIMLACLLLTFSVITAMIISGVCGNSCPCVNCNLVLSRIIN